MTPPTRYTPSVVATMFSPDWTVMPSHTPFSNLSSKSPIRRLVLGTLNITVSPKGRRGLNDFWPFILVSDVRPQS